MTEFILVPGMFTGAHVWEDTAAHLASAGAGVHTAALTGLDGAPGAATDTIDLETHIADVLALIDSAGTGRDREIVLVGHGYGTYPVLGAAGRRAERIARIISLDTAPGQDGMPALATVTDPALREELATRAAAEGNGPDLAAPARDAWQRWGSTAGIPEAALDRLTALASPQPLRTLLQPLRLTGEAGSLPVTGVLCNANGSSIELVQQQVDFGNPALLPLADPRISFFELPTGHWPMLSLPDGLAEVLLRAAAGEGHRLSAPGSAEPPTHLRPFPLDVPELRGERTGNVDLYLPDAEGPRPAVLFVHGGPVPAGVLPTPRDWPVLQGYARYAAAEGAVGVTFDHRLHDTAGYPRAAADVAAAVEQVRADPRVDADRIALWFFSGGGLMAADWLGRPPAWLRCLAGSYPVMAPIPAWGPVDSRFRPVDAVAGAGTLPVVLTRVGRETPGIAATVEEFLDASTKHGVDVEVVDVPNGHHSFETVDPTEESREAVRRAMRSVLGHLSV
ncbi:dienelactone hydrolase family protein [Streptomyces sp. NBC_00876]|uniref:alpha/beta fold hydrolase n=1 Tax=Streptomyces sp. NBC_00876 TaxID=2975853 RepID=UPI0038654978|nr:dienelactone hydrolase family protein [Streptomyces sp. NBC_00876]